MEGAPSPAPNLLLGREPPTAIDQVWVTDITYIPVAGLPWLYLAMVMDLFSRRVIGWKLGPDLRAGLAVDALASALAKRAPTAAGLIAHGDQGSQYGSGAYRRRLESIHALQSMSRRGNCYDNASMESCFGTIKDEMLEGGEFDSPDDAHTELSTTSRSTTIAAASTHPSAESRLRSSKPNNKPELKHLGCPKNQDQLKSAHRGQGQRTRR